MINSVFRRNIEKIKIIGLNQNRSLSVIEKLQTEKTDESVSFPENGTEIRKINCNKSGLLNHHRNLLHSKTPYKEPSSWIHLTEKYQRKIFGRYGSESGVNPRISFKTISDKNSQIRYERFSEPEKLLSMITKFKTEQRNRIDEIIKREADITNKIEKLNQWKQDLQLRTAKKEADALAARQKRERLVEEVRRHFGYKVDPRDERFKEVLEQKEREDKKKQKEEKRKAKELKLMSKLTENSAAN